MRGFLASFVMLMRQIGARKTAEGNEPEDPQPRLPRFFLSVPKIWQFLDEIPSQLSSLFQSFPQRVDGQVPTEVSKFCTFSTRKHEGIREIPPLVLPFRAKQGGSRDSSLPGKKKRKAGEARTFSRLSLSELLLYPSQISLGSFPHRKKV